MVQKLCVEITLKPPALMEHSPLREKSGRKSNKLTELNLLPLVAQEFYTSLTPMKFVY